MTDHASRAGYRAAEEELDRLDRLDALRERYADMPAPPQPRVTWHEWLANAPTKRLVVCAVTGCGRDGLAYVNHRASVCVDCLRALRARTCNETEVDDE